MKSLTVFNSIFQRSKLFNLVSAAIYSTFFALFLSASSIIILGIQIFRWLRFGVPFDGFGTVVGILLLLIGFLFTAVAILSEYIGLIYNETKGRPHFIIDEIY